MLFGKQNGKIQTLTAQGCLTGRWRKALFFIGYLLIPVSINLVILCQISFKHQAADTNLIQQLWCEWKCYYAVLVDSLYITSLSEGINISPGEDRFFRRACAYPEDHLCHFLLVNITIDRKGMPYGYELWEMKTACSQGKTDKILQWIQPL